MTRLVAPPIFQDPASQLLQLRIADAAATDHHVLLQGATGTGKRRMARHLHACSRRASGPFIAIDCSALDAETLANSMRGHEAGAVRGGFAAMPGWFESALDGTLFLDEVHAMPLQLQDELLSILRSGQVCRIGGTRATMLNVRLVLATSQDLALAADQGHFRADLLGLASVVSLQMLPLRDRPGDILPLAQHLINQQCRHLKQPLPQLSACAVQALLQHAWPSHIRELETTLHRALLSASDGVIRAVDLGLPSHADGPAGLRAQPEAGAARAPSLLPEEALLAELDAVLGALSERFEGRLFEVVERALFGHAHRRCGQHQTQAARLLGVTRNVLRGRLIALGEIDARR